MNEGRWVTINGTHVFVKDGQSPMDAFVRQGANKEKNVSNNETSYTKETFKDYIEKELEDVKPYISKIRKSKENRLGQFGIYITGNETISPTTNRFYTYETYIPYEENKEYLRDSINLAKEELRTFSRKKK